MWKTLFGKKKLRKDESKLIFPNLKENSYKLESKNKN